MTDHPYRQGDVLIVPVEKARLAGARVQRRQKGEGLILASGEASGHHHRIRDARARLRRRGDQLFLTVAEGGGGATLTHEEHDPIHVDAGQYEVVQQREHVPARRPARNRPARNAQTSRVYD